MKHVTGVILAGGKSSRMGTDKGLLQFKGKPMIQHIIDTLEKLKIPIIVISNNVKYKQFGYPVFEDEEKDKGPVGGIYTALLHSDTETNIILSCDSPNVSPSLLSHLVNNSTSNEVVLPKLNNRIHPLIGVYKKSSLDTFKEHLKNNQLKLRIVCDELNSCILDLSEHPEFNKEEFFININTPDEHKKHTQ